MISARTVWTYAGAELLTVVAFSLVVPAAVVEASGRGASAMGVSAMTFLPAIVHLAMASAAPRARRRIGRTLAFRTGIGLVGALILGFAIAQETWQWVVLAAFNGLYAPLLWTFTDTLIAENAPTTRTGAWTGAYQTLLALAFLLGPLSGGLTRWSVATLSLFAAALVVVSAIVVLLAPGIDVSSEADPDVRHREILRTEPVLVVGALAGGVFEAGIQGMTSWNAVASGATPMQALMLPVVIAAGSLIMQVPFGLRADRFGTERVLRGAATALVIASLSITIDADLLRPAAVVWGGAGGAVYTLILTAAARRTSTASRLLATTAAAYLGGHLVGPLLGGLGSTFGGLTGFGLILTALSSGLAFVVAPRAPLMRCDALSVPHHTLDHLP
jgi:MFS family permease